MIFDCFFSYQHDDLNIVKAMVQKLEEKGLRCWYAPRNVQGRYAKAIAEGISHSKVFVVVLNARSAVSEAVLNEVEMAHNISKNGDFAVIQPVCTEAFDFDAAEYQEMMYYIRRRHFINTGPTIDFGELADSIIRSQPKLLGVHKQRGSSDYVVQPKEDRRLMLQNELLNMFDNDVYERVINQYANPVVLDVGCGTGDMLIPKLQNHNISALVGIDKNERQIHAARSKYREFNYHFYEMNVESESFEAEFAAVHKNIGLGKFDIINISMVLLHLKNPGKLLATLYNILADGGTLIIRDIDDGINFAYPDDTNAFERIYKMCENDEQFGSRRNGRRIYHDLVKAGFSEVKLQHQGLTSIGLNEEQKESLFCLYFPFTLENAKIMAEKYPGNIEYREDYAWYRGCFDDIHKLFLSSDFVFSLGFMSYTARK